MLLTITLTPSIHPLINNAAKESQKTFDKAKIMGTVTSVVFGGCMTIGVVIFTWFKAPSLRKMEY